MEILRITDLKVHFPIRKGILARTVDHVKAVDGVSFGLEEGEVLGIVGESGSGKSTVARVLCGLQQPTSGKVELPGMDRTAGPSVGPRASVAMVFQDPLGSLNPRQTARAMLEEVLRKVAGKGGVANSPTAVELLERVGMDASALDKYPHEFSGGQRQRLCIARAIALEPKILICDEAVSALDLSIRSQILELLLGLRRELGLSMIFITHDLGVVRYIADRVLVMNRGRIVEQGPCAEVMSEPKNEYTKRLLAAVPRIRRAK